MLAPTEPRDFAAVFDSQFRGMTREPVTVGQLLDARTRLLARIHALMDDRSRAFLLSVELEIPRFDLIGLPPAATMPGVRRKLWNLGQRTAVKRKADYRQLGETLERIAAGRGG